MPEKTLPPTLTKDAHTRASRPRYLRRAFSSNYVTALDSSCLLHIGGGLARLRTGVRTTHLAEILAATE